MVDRRPVRKKAHNKRWILLLVLIGFLAAPVSAEVYKYKDENGNWHFSDQAPESDETDVEVMEIDSVPSHTSDRAPVDLAKSLAAKFPSGTVVETTTLAVVLVKTTLGSGAGFFVSKDGYLVTNRHVLEPTSTTQWAQQEQEFKDALEQVDLAKKELSLRAKKLDIDARELVAYENDLVNLPNDQRELAEERLNLYKKEHEDKEASFLKIKKDWKKEARNLNEAYGDFRYASNLSRVDRNFIIQLKDDTELNLSLIAFGKRHDLALLKLDGHQTPYLEIPEYTKPIQGTSVFAVGSPLGRKDFVTSGIVTNASNDEITIDAQILPGNSGGPLLTSDGILLGVNTLKLLSDESTGSAGFGVAIPIKAVKEEFGRYLNKLPAAAVGDHQDPSAISQ